MELDIQAAQAVHRAKLFERAVHDPGPWAVRVGDTTEWAIKIRTQRGVVFVAHFEPGTTGDVAWLLCHGEEMSSKLIDASPKGFALEWRLSYVEDDLVRA